MDSVRYFEFEFVWQALRGTSIHNYLDVSSPRLFPIVLVRERPEISATFINPDKGDLQETATLVKACGLDPRCQLRECLIESAPFAPESFDVITSISVVEHIPQDKKAIRKIWDLLRPGGKLFLSVPCAAAAEVEYIDVDFYGVQAADEIGFFFHQYKYDLPLLEERMFSVTGPPVRLGIYGEKTAGVLNRWLLKRWRGEPYPLWKEPYALARNFQRYDSLRELPGDGVIAMEFIKK
jgi:SAM-dependent methyltransferase